MSNILLSALGSISSTTRKKGDECGGEQLISVVRRLRQEDCKFKVNLDYAERPCLKENKVDVLVSLMST